MEKIKIELCTNLKLLKVKNQYMTTVEARQWVPGWGVCITLSALLLCMFKNVQINKNLLKEKVKDKEKNWKAAEEKQLVT